MSWIRIKCDDCSAERSIQVKCEHCRSSDVEPAGDDDDAIGIFGCGCGCGFVVGMIIVMIIGALS
jgi:hypothetical protein